MNTVKIRETHPELIKRIHETIRSYKNWEELQETIKKEGTREELIEAVLYKYDVYGNFYNLTEFLYGSLIDDIEELSQVISEDDKERE